MVVFNTRLYVNKEKHIFLPQFNCKGCWIQKWVWYHIPIILALGRLRQDDGNFKAGNMTQWIKVLPEKAVDL